MSTANKRGQKRPAPASGSGRPVKIGAGAAKSAGDVDASVPAAAADKADPFVGAAHAAALATTQGALLEAPGWRVLWGEPGTGKTLLARKVCEALCDGFVQCWVQGASEAALRAGLLDFGRLHAGIDGNVEDAAGLAAVRAFLAHPARRCLLVVDDACDAAMVRRFAPAPGDGLGQCRVPLTAPADLGLAAVATRVPAFETDESIELLCCGLGGGPAVQQLVQGHAELRAFFEEEVGNLPLTVGTIVRALELSGAKGADLGAELQRVVAAVRSEPVDALEAPNRRLPRGLMGSVRAAVRAVRMPRKVPGTQPRRKRRTRRPSLYRW